MIRKAKTDDLEALMPMAERFYNSCPWKDVAAFDEASSRAGMAALLANDSAGVFVIDKDGGLKGAAGFVLTPVWLAADFIVAQEIFWWVELGASREALELWRTGERWAKNRGADAQVMIRLDGMRDEALHRLYQRRGYNPVEHHYVRRVV